MDPKTLLLTLHVLGVAFGVGGVVMLDVAILKRLRAPVGAGDRALVDHVAVFVRLGLVLLWASGMGILATAPGGPAEVITNPKVQAKLVIVVVLTLNAALVESLALPLVAGNRGRPLLHGVAPARRAIAIAAGAVSCTSWAAAFVLGMARGWNHVVPAADILAAWLALVTVTSLVAAALVVALDRLPRRVPAGDVVGAPVRNR
ncbi:hypothetical protein ACTZWW_14260 [Salinarimonas sp. NSM]|uniref:hypothetical protein n=1 Tax=Salinarimonas sp. NSM TaxID=3458003 RepID=UPI004035F647